MYATPSGALVFVNSTKRRLSRATQGPSSSFRNRSRGEWDSHIPLLHPDNHAETRRVWSSCLALGVRASSFRVRNIEGNTTGFLSRAEPLRASEWNASTLDLGLISTLTKRAGPKLTSCEQSAFRQMAQRLSHTGVPERSGTKRMFLVEETARIYGYPPIGPTPNLILQRAILKMWPFQERSRTNWRAGRVIDFENRLLMPDGSIKHIRSLAHSLGTRRQRGICLRNHGYNGA